MSIEMKALCEFADCCAGTGGAANRQLRLLKRVQAHDHMSFREFVEQLQSKLFSVSYALLGNSTEADVAAQKVFVRLYRATRRVDR